MERSRVAVSPFDGINRIRFKGSLALTIANFRSSIDSANSNWIFTHSAKSEIGKSKIGNVPDSQPQSCSTSAPPKRFDCQCEWIL